jgi:hypothetical protein
MWLAYVEGAEDARSALSAVDAIIQRYEAAGDIEEWEPGTAAFAANAPWRRGSKARPSGPFSEARPRFAQRRRGLRARPASRSWRLMIARALLDGAPDDPQDGRVRERKRSRVRCKTSSSGDGAIRAETADHRHAIAL